MYSPTTRLLTVLELLQSYKQMSGTEMARRLEIDTRTVRRYITMLQDMGIPVVSERGPHGSYRLQRGSRLPPLMFNDAEVITLTLGLLATREFHFPIDVAAVEGALAKIERVLPENLLMQSRSLQETIVFNVYPPPTHAQNNLIMLLSLAVQQRKQVSLSYQAQTGEPTRRDFDPYGVVFNAGYWYTVGYCHLRHSVRVFRLDRITNLEAGEQSFERPEDFDALAHVVDSIKSLNYAYQVEIVFKTTMDEAHEAISWWYSATLEQTSEGVIFRLETNELTGLANFLLNLDFSVKIRQPTELQHLIRQKAARALQMVE
jgi:predicted DNA-binding transcriptional regulator YafY